MESLGLFNQLLGIGANAMGPPFSSEFIRATMYLPVTGFEPMSSVRLVCYRLGQCENSCHLPMWSVTYPFVANFCKILIIRLLHRVVLGTGHLI